MRGDTLSWEQIVDAVLEHGNDDETLDAIEFGEGVSTGSAGVLEGHEEDLIIIGTDDGDIELDEDQIRYPDGTVTSYDDDEHRDTLARTLLPADIVASFK